MKQLSSFTLVTLLAVTLSFTACTSETTIAVEEETTEATVDEQTSGEMTLSLSFGTSSTSRAVGKAVARDDDDTSTTTEELQTAEEKQVTRLIAVIFNNSTQGTVSSDYTVEEDDGSTYFSYFDIIGGSSSETELDETKQYEISFLANSGAYYELCFVANPSETMEACITGDDSTEDALTSESTIADFKALIETQDPGTKPMTMVSTAFYGVTMSDDDDSPDLGTVHLQRIMSRIDIINLGDGITVTKAVLYNRTSSSVLISDAQSSGTTSEFLQADGETFDFTEDGSEGLVGSSYQTAGISADEYSALESTTYTVTDDDGNSTTYDYVVNASKATIYSYEQYEDSSIPYIELYYTVSGGSNTYVHTVNFVTTSDDTTDEEPLYFNRNYCYRIFLDYNPADAMTVSITVEDWDEDVEIEISQYEVTTGIGVETSDVEKASDVEIGDFILSDGTIVDSAIMGFYHNQVYSTTKKTLGENAIAIVCYVYDEEAGTTRVGDGALEALGGSATGIAMGLKDVGKALWSTSLTLIGTNYSLAIKALNDLEGYTLTQSVIALDTYSADTYPIFYEVVNYEPEAPDYSTGWYLPSFGEFGDMINGLSSESIVKSSSFGTTTWDTTLKPDDMSALMETINGLLSRVGEGNYDALYDFSTETKHFWVCTEHNKNGNSARYFRFGESSIYVAAATKNVSTFYARSFFTFLKE